MSKVAIFVDVTNISEVLHSRFNKWLDYSKIRAHYDDVKDAYAYGYIYNQNASGIAMRTALLKIGYKLNFIQYRHRDSHDYYVQMAVDICRCLGECETIVIVSADTRIIPIIKFLREEGITVKIIGCNVPISIRSCAESVVEITEDMLYDKAVNAVEQSVQQNAPDEREG